MKTELAPVAFASVNVDMIDALLIAALVPAIAALLCRMRADVSVFALTAGVAAYLLAS